MQKCNINFCFCFSFSGVDTISHMYTYVIDAAKAKRCEECNQQQ